MGNRLRRTLIKKQSIGPKLKENLLKCKQNYNMDVDELSECGRTSLHYCCITHPFGNAKCFRSKDVMKCLLKLDANINAQDQTGYTPLMYAVKNQLYEETAVRIKHEADPYIENEDGTSAMVLAHGCGDQSQLFLRTLTNASRLHGQENNQIVQCQIQLNQICRFLSKEKGVVDECKQRKILASLKQAEEDLQLFTSDPKVNRELKIQNDVLNDNRQMICQEINPEHI